MADRKPRTDCGQIIQLDNRILRKSLLQIICQGLCSVCVSSIGKGQRQTVIHVSSRRIPFCNCGLLACFVSVAKQGFPQGRYGIVSCSSFFLPGSLRRLRSSIRELPSSLKMSEVCSCVALHSP